MDIKLVFNYKRNTCLWIFSLVLTEHMLDLKYFMVVNLDMVVEFHKIALNLRIFIRNNYTKKRVYISKDEVIIHYFGNYITTLCILTLKQKLYTNVQNISYWTYVEII